MAGYNLVVLVGNLTSDPELRRTGSGMAVTDLRLAVNNRGRKQDGQGKDEALFIDVTVWDKQAEACAQYLAKGRPVLVSGRLIMEQWDDKQTGQKRTKHKVVASVVQFLGKGGDGQAEDEKQAAADRAAADARLNADIPF